MSYILAERTESRSRKTSDVFLTCALSPIYLLWVIAAICIIPFALLAIPLQHWFENKPRLHYRILVVLSALAITNTITLPVIAAYYLFS